MVEPYRSFIHQASQMSWDWAVTLPFTIPATSLILASSNSGVSVSSTTYPFRVLFPAPKGIYTWLPARIFPASSPGTRY